MMKQGVWVPRGQKSEKLTARETQVAVLLSRGRTTAEVAGELGISAETVKVYVHNIYGRIDVHDRTLLIKYVIEKGLDK